MDRGAEQHGTLLPEVTHRALHVGTEARQVGALVRVRVRFRFRVRVRVRSRARVRVRIRVRVS